MKATDRYLPFLALVLMSWFYTYHQIRELYTYGALLVVPPSSNSKRLIIFNAGQGTTGTRSFQNALCDLGIPSVHWVDRLECTASNLAVHHQIALDAFNVIRECRRKRLNLREECSFQNLKVLVQTIKNASQALLETDRVAAILDSPYPHFAPFIINMIRSHHSSWIPFIMLTDRNSDLWATSRLEHHNEFLCKPLLGKHVYGALDLDECIAAAEAMSPPPHTIRDVLVHYSDMDPEQAHAHFAIAMDEFRKRILEMNPDYVVNLWDTSMDDNNIRRDLQRHILKVTGVSV